MNDAVLWFALVGAWPTAGALFAAAALVWLWQWWRR